MMAIPVSAIIPTRNRSASLGKVFESLAGQGLLPAELIVVDGSSDGLSRTIVDAFATYWMPTSQVKWHRASELGAAAQRNQGVACSTQPFIWFIDDDILFEPSCVERLWQAINRDVALGGVNAMILNQCYHPPGTISRNLFALMRGKREHSYAGRVLGPAINLLPEDSNELPELVSTEWLNTTCTIYRRQALPDPPFDSVFTGYSLMEDLTLSLRVGKTWRLANVRTARILHNSQPGPHKADAGKLAEMELLNRHYVMTRVMHRTGVINYLRLALWEAFQLASCTAQSSSRRNLYYIVKGKLRALLQICRTHKSDGTIR